MPRYDYKCPVCQFEVEIQRPMDAPGEQYPLCPNCGQAEMVRKFSMPMVNWGGLKPSAGELHPETKQLIEDAPRRRDHETPHQSNRLARLNEEAKKHGLS